MTYLVLNGMDFLSFNIISNSQIRPAHTCASKHSNSSANLPELRDLHFFMAINQTGTMKAKAKINKCCWIRKAFSTEIINCLNDIARLNTNENVLFYFLSSCCEISGYGLKIIRLWKVIKYLPEWQNFHNRTLSWEQLLCNMFADNFAKKLKKLSNLVLIINCQCL